MKRSNTQPFSHNPHHQTYHLLLPIQSDFRNRKVDCACFASRLKQLLWMKDKDFAEEDALFQAAMEFLNKVKLRFKNDQAVYDSFLNALTGSQIGDQLYKKVAAVLGDHPDLMDEFHRNCEIFSVNKEQEDENNDASNDSNEVSGVDFVYKKGFNVFQNIRNMLNGSDEYLNFLRKVHEYNRGRIGIKDLFQSLAKYPCIMGQFEEFFKECDSIGGNTEVKSEKAEHKRLKIENKVKHKRLKTKKKVEHKRKKIESGKEDQKKHKDWDKPLRDLDFSNSEHVTPSYWHVPQDFVVPKSSQRSELDVEVLNDEWIGRDPGKMNYRIRNHNVYEQALNKCEDDRCGADVLLGRLKSTINRIEELLNGDIFDIKKDLSILQLRCVENFCSDMELTENNSEIVLNCIVDRLRLKLEESEKEFSRCDRIWVDVTAKCMLKLKPKLKPKEESKPEDRPDKCENP